jgi:hypothetical protein
MVMKRRHRIKRARINKHNLILRSITGAAVLGLWWTCRTIEVCTVVPVYIDILMMACLLWLVTFIYANERRFGDDK